MVRRKSRNLVADTVWRVVPVITLRHFLSPYSLSPYYPHRTMVYLPTPLSLESSNLPAYSQRGPSEPVLIPLVHHDDPVANQIGLATNQNQNLIQSLQSNSSQRISSESVRPSILFSSPERI
jgi:hypothetical protein